MLTRYSGDMKEVKPARKAFVTATFLAQVAPFEMGSRGLRSTKRFNRKRPAWPVLVEPRPAVTSFSVDRWQNGRSRRWFKTATFGRFTHFPQTLCEHTILEYSIVLFKKMLSLTSIMFLEVRFMECCFPPYVQIAVVFFEDAE